MKKEIDKAKSYMKTYTRKQDVLTLMEDFNDKISETLKDYVERT